MPGTCWPRPASPTPAASATSRTRGRPRSSDGLAWAQLAAALNHVGEPGRARLAFAKARDMVNARRPQRLLRLGPAQPRRPAGAGAGSRRPRGPRQVASLVGERLTANVDHTTTQEQAWLVMAARAMRRLGGELAYSVDGEHKNGHARPGRDQPRPAAIAARRAREERRQRHCLDAGHGARRAQRAAACRHPGPERAARVT